MKLDLNHINKLRLVVLERLIAKASNPLRVGTFSKEDVEFIERKERELRKMINSSALISVEDVRKCLED